MTPMEWTGDLLRLWGKTSNDDPTAYKPVVVHLEEAAFVATKLWDHWVPGSMKRLLGEGAGDMLTFMAGIHDIGKITPSFQVMRRDLCPWPISDKPKTKHAGHHTVTGYVDVAKRLADKGLDTRWAEIVGTHHGEPVKRGHVEEAANVRPLMGEQRQWADARKEVFDAFWSRCSMDSNPVIHSTPDRVTLSILTGLVVMTDWIASNTNFFGLRTHFDIDAAENGWRKAGVPGAVQWPEFDFESQFGFTPNVMQQHVMAAAREIDGPGLILVEESTGGGKTAAAQSVASIMAERFGMGGVVMAMPNKASASLKLDDFAQWTTKLGVEPERALWMVHSGARFDDRYLRMQDRRSSCFGLDDDKGHLLDRNDLSPMAPVVLCTVDQVARIALDARHQQLRLAGFVGKTVVFDEVHSYDVFMQTYLLRTVEWLAATGVPVVMLSATLPPSLRRKLVQAYHGGVVPDSVADSDGYPLITTAVRGGAIRQRTVPSKPSTVTFDVVNVDDDPSVIIDWAERVTADGGNLLVVRNTVKRANATYDILKEKFATTLVTSRFTGLDRAAKEAELKPKFGTGTGGSAGEVVVGTQVLEQSLDVDFDVLVTDLAPTDAIIQRAGRVMRAEREPKLPPTIVVLGGVVTEYNRLPYDGWVMCQSKDVWERETFTRPDDIVKMIRETYEVDRHHSLLDEHDSAARSQRNRASVKLVAPPDGDSMDGMLHGASKHDRIRDIDGTQTVILFEHPDGSVRFPDGSEAPWGRLPTREELSKLAGSSVNISSFNRKYIEKSLVKGTPEAWKRTPMEAFDILLLTYSETAPNSGAHHIDYDQERGLTW